MIIPIEKIAINERLRQVDQDKVKELASSIKEVGLINPVTVSKDFVLVAGNHRIEAVKSLGRAEIEANVVDVENELYLELAEIDENLIRNELHYIDRGRHLLRRKEIYEELYPETKVGQFGNKGGKVLEKTESDFSRPSFVKEASSKIGKSETVVKEELQIANKVLTEVQEVLKEKDVPKTDALKIARMEPEQQKKVAEKLVDGAKSVVDAHRLIKKDEIHETPALSGKYRVIYADPPWRYNDKRDGSTTGAEDHYPTMSIEELCEMPVKELAETDAVLFLWTTSPLLEDTFKVINAWGFKYKTSFVWDKIKHNLGHYNSVRHEFLLVCTRGSCTPDNVKLFDSVQSIERTEHSVKPEEFRQIIETLYNVGNKIELFSRKKVNGWEVWGNQA